MTFNNNGEKVNKTEMDVTTNWQKYIVHSEKDSHNLEVP